VGFPGGLFPGRVFLFVVGERLVEQPTLWWCGGGSGVLISCCVSSLDVVTSAWYGLEAGRLGGGAWLSFFFFGGGGAGGLVWGVGLFFGFFGGVFFLLVVLVVLGGGLGGGFWGGFLVGGGGGFFFFPPFVSVPRPHESLHPPSFKSLTASLPRRRIDMFT